MSAKRVPRAAEMREPIARVCVYANQVCTIAKGCPTVQLMGPFGHRPRIEKAALDCTHAGEPLLGREVRTGLIDRARDVTKPRELVRQKLIARNQAELLALADREQKLAADSALYAASRAVGSGKAKR